MTRIIKKIPIEVVHYGMLIVSAIAMAVSLFFSEVMELPPCVLCWYQRIAMYPIVFLAIVGIVRKDTNAYTYIAPLALGGLGISIYHNLLYWKILPESIAPCKLGISCTTKFFEWFGFITIPFLSLIAFVLVTVLVIISYKKNTYEKPHNN
jgi:disulfide bond formation protein DsbB